MKKKIFTVLLISLSLGIVSCGNRTEEKKDPPAKQEQEIQIQDSEKEPEKKPEKQPEEEKQPEIEKANIILYRVQGDDIEIVKEEKEIDCLTEQAVWDALKESGCLETGAEIRSFHKEGTRLELDVNAAFGEQLRSYGTAGEQAMMTCVVNTFLSTYQCEKIKITEEGNVLETGHAIYEDDLIMYE